MLGKSWRIELSASVFGRASLFSVYLCVRFFFPYDFLHGVCVRVLRESVLRVRVVCVGCVCVCVSCSCVYVCIYICMCVSLCVCVCVCVCVCLCVTLWASKMRRKIFL